jgi:hypothetical protein
MRWRIPGASRRRVVGIGAAVTTATTYRSQLIELRAADKAGSFYMSSQAEFLNSKRAGFTFTGQVPGYVAYKAIRGTLPLYRLRSASRASSAGGWSAARRSRRTCGRAGDWTDRSGTSGRTSSHDVIERTAPAAGPFSCSVRSGHFGASFAHVRFHHGIAWTARRSLPSASR